MNSPITGKEMELTLEIREFTYRKEKFTYTATLWLCQDSGEKFTTTKMDEVNFGQVYNQYREKYGIPFPNEIRDIRAIYGLSATKMSDILGFGENQYRLYENGEMPSEANGKILKSILSYDVFYNFVKNAENQFDAKDFKKICDKLDDARGHIEETNSHADIFRCKRSQMNGYASLSYSRLKNILLYFINGCKDVYNTKMNKLLFYADFLSYKERGISMSGLAYKAIQYGPVPDRYPLIYSSIDDITSDIIVFQSGYTGELLKASVEPDMRAFSTEDLEILNAVCAKFKNLNATQLSYISHKEAAWENHLLSGDYIPFDEAFKLKAL